ncbi:hypothetical protein Q5P01_009559 [Channa striata]|uniref:EGF-like domain-containing protein n=1 Tax=Channa striata TaxID=64152 RepID=A0AA88N0N7_CHASR|nr:hypothetical protein Q5P01_009559 [Channa striata]
MRRLLLCAWILTLRADALQLQHPAREAGAVGRGWTRQGPGGPAPPRLDANEPPAVRGSGGKPRGGRAGGRRGAAERVSGRSGSRRLCCFIRESGQRFEISLTPHVCGDQCCEGWTLSPKTRRCTKPRCFPGCQHQALCRRSNHCECRPGFQGFRCKFFSVTLSPLTSTHSTIKPTWFPVHRTAEPTVIWRIHRLAQSRLTAVRAGPAGFVPSSASNKKTTKDGAAGLNLTSPPGEIHHKQEAPKNSELKTEGKGRIDRVLIQEEKGVSPKTEEVNMKPEGRLTWAELETEFNKVQFWAEKPEDGAELVETLLSSVEETLPSDSEEQRASPKMSNVDPNPESRTEEGEALDSQTKDKLSKSPYLESVSLAKTDRKLSLDLKHRSKMKETKVIQQSEGSKTSNLESNPMPKGEDAQHVETNSGPQVGKGKPPESKSTCDCNKKHLESNTGFQGAKGHFELNCGTKVEEGVNLDPNLKSTSEDRVESSQVKSDSRSEEEDKGLGSPETLDMESNPGL